MRSRLTAVFVVGVACGLGVSAAEAGPGCCASKKKGQAAKASCASKSPCQLGDFPTMAMKVGETTYECAATAQRAAADNGAKVVFVVGDEGFASKDKAVVALASATEQYVKEFTTIACLVDGKLVHCAGKSEAGCAAACGSKGRKTCASKGPCGSKAKKGTVAKAETETEGHWREKGKLVKSAKATCGQKAEPAKTESKAVCGNSKCEKFFVLGREFGSHAAAVKARDEALSAVKKINMTYIVDGQEAACPTQASPEAKMAGKVQFVVEGLKTDCEYVARAALARAKYDAATSTIGKVTRL